jgi:spore coat polysaccharide biosynthesis predicted glycosyltransferase SpsG
MKKILFIPAVKKNNGTGHLKRTIKWAKSPLYKSFIYIPDEDNIASKIPDLNEISSIVSSLSGKYDMAVFDMRETEQSLIKEVEKIADILVSVDEGGRERNFFDYLIDTLPNTVSKSVPPNIFSTDLLGYQRRYEAAKEKYF